MIAILQSCVFIFAVSMPRIYGLGRRRKNAERNRQIQNQVIGVGRPSKKVCHPC